MMMSMMTSGARAKAETMRRARNEREWHQHNKQTRAKLAGATAQFHRRFEQGFDTVRAETNRRATAEKQCHKRFEQSFAKVRTETNRRARADNDWRGYDE